ncbi:hypothetical protein [Streptomyces sp. PA5.6]|uniref:hypothetical protein n=1 Tax=Streptomyces sp. PA5.6 TaxID=3035651 RepID=UPI003904772D
MERRPAQRVIEDHQAAYPQAVPGADLVVDMPAPVMWDSQTDERSGERTNSTPVDRKLFQDGDTVELTLSPESRFLADPDTKYPVTIDPATDGLSTLVEALRECASDLKLPAGASLSTLGNSRILISSGTGNDIVTHGAPG